MSLMLILGGVATFWRKFQRERVDTANDRGQVSFLATLRAERDTAVERADKLSEHLNLAIREIGSMKGKLDFLTEQVSSQSEQIRAQSQEIASLRKRLEGGR